MSLDKDDQSGRKEVFVPLTQALRGKDHSLQPTILKIEKRQL